MKKSEKKVSNQDKSFDEMQDAQQHDFIEFERNSYDVKKMFGKTNLSLMDDDPTEEKRRQAKGFKPPKNP